MYFIQQLYKQFSLSFKLSFEGENPELSFRNLEGKENSQEPRRVEDATALHGRAETLVRRLDTTLATANQRTQPLTFGTRVDSLSGENGDTPLGEPQDLSMGHKETEQDISRNTSSEGLSMGEKVLPNSSQIDPELQNELITSMSQEERSDFEKKTSEEQAEYLQQQINDREHQKLIEEMIGLGIDGLDEESLRSTFGGMSPEEIAEFNAMTPEEQTNYMLQKHADRVAGAEEIIARERARLEAEARSASPERQAEIGGQIQRLGQMSSAIQGQGPGNTGFYRGEAGTLTPEQIAEYGRTGEQLAQYAATCNPATNERSYCGKNTGEALNGFYRSIGKPELQIQDRPRHGYKWAEMLASRPEQYREINVPANQAPAGAIISYAAGPGGSSAFAQYGHVEIALGNGEYYFGQRASSPGGSRRPPVEGQYRVFMPIALGNSEGLSPDTAPSAMGIGVR